MPSDPSPTVLPSLAELHEQDARELRVLLLDLAKDGGSMAKLYVQQAQDQAYESKPGVGPSPPCARSYVDVARSVRQTVMLVQKLTEPAPVAKVVRAAPDKVVVRKQIIRRVEDAIHQDAAPYEAECLRAEFMERMETPEFEEELGARPVQEIVNEIRADLGLLGADSLVRHKRRTPRDLAVLQARAAVGPFVSPMPPRGWRGDAPPGGSGSGAGIWQGDSRIRGP